MRLAIFCTFVISLSFVSAAHSQTTNTQKVADCIWSKLPADLRQDYLDAYNGKAKGPFGMMNAFHGSAIRACTGREAMPIALADMAVVSQALQHGSASKLAALSGLSVERLDAAWAKAPPEAVQCHRANGADLLKIKSEPCSDRKALFWFIPVLKISEPASNYPTVSELLTYFNAKAQAQIIGELVAKFIAEQR